MADTEWVTGTDIESKVQLNINSAVFAIDSGAVIKAAVRYRDTLISSQVTLNNSHADADLPNSLVVVEFSAAESVGWVLSSNNRLYDLEINVNDPLGVGDRSWIIEGITIDKGLVS